MIFQGDGGPDPLPSFGSAHASTFLLSSHTYVFSLCVKPLLHGYIKPARDESHYIYRLELGKYDVFSETQTFVLTNNLRCFDETDVRISQKTTYAQFKIYRTSFIDEIGPRTTFIETNQ